MGNIIRGSLERFIRMIKFIYEFIFFRDNKKNIPPSCQKEQTGENWFLSSGQQDMSQISLTSQCSRQLEDDELKKRIQQLTNQQKLIKDKKNSQTQDRLAQINAKKLDIYCQYKLTSKSKPILAKLLQIYDRNLNIYFEEKITVLSNYALVLDSQNKYEKCRKIYKQLKRLLDKYYSKQDERRYLIANNLATLKYKFNKDQSKAIFKYYLANGMENAWADSPVLMAMKQNYQSLFK